MYWHHQPQLVGSEVTYFVRGEPKVGPSSVLRHILVVELKSLSLNCVSSQQLSSHTQQREATSTHLIISYQDERLFSDGREPGHGGGCGTLFYPVCAVEPEVIDTATGEVILHLHSQRETTP